MFLCKPYGILVVHIFVSIALGKQLFVLEVGKLDDKLVGKLVEEFQYVLL